MSAPSDNETWLIEIADELIQKKATQRPLRLTLLERLVYCLWVADYDMRNAGDLDTATELYADFQNDARQLSVELRLLFTHETFSLPKEALEQEYFDRFERVCDEIKSA